MCLTRRFPQRILRTMYTEHVNSNHLIILCFVQIWIDVAMRAFAENKMWKSSLNGIANGNSSILFIVIVWPFVRNSSIHHHYRIQINLSIPENRKHFSIEIWNRLPNYVRVRAVSLTLPVKAWQMHCRSPTIGVRSNLKSSRNGRHRRHRSFILSAKSSSAFNIPFIF